MGTMLGTNWNLDDDRKTVTVTFPTNPPVALKLGVAEVDEILLNLGNFRALMQPEVAADWTPGTKAEAIPNPAWRTEYDAMFEHPVLHLRDPRLGWLHYLLPHHEAKALGDSLVLLGLLPPPAAPPKENQN